MAILEVTFQNKHGRDPEPASINKKNSIRIILFGGVDILGEGDYGNAKNIGKYIELYSQSKNIELEKGDIQVYNSPYMILSTTTNKYTTSDIIEEQIYDVVYKKLFIDRAFDKKNGLCIIYGYSFGGQYAIGLSKYLNRKGVFITALYTIDGAKGPGSASKSLGIPTPPNFKVDTTIPSNVRFNLNIYQTNRSNIGSRGFPNTGSTSTLIKNIDLTSSVNIKGDEILHDNIDEYTSGMITQSVIYFLQNNHSIMKMNESDIKDAIKRFDNELFY